MYDDTSGRVLRLEPGATEWEWPEFNKGKRGFSVDTLNKMFRTHRYESGIIGKAWLSLIVDGEGLALGRPKNMGINVLHGFEQPFGTIAIVRDIGARFVGLDEEDLVTVKALDWRPI